LDEPLHSGSELVVAFAERLEDRGEDLHLLDVFGVRVVLISDHVDLSQGLVGVFQLDGGERPFDLLEEEGLDHVIEGNLLADFLEAPGNDAPYELGQLEVRLFEEIGVLFLVGLVESEHRSVAQRQVLLEER